ncbi:hypothetical protein GF361_00045 [Candidatus Woesearchaeota archaeon]|nr:hypothetical protein [Candidatus Woesearchaeota archaeon]
MKRGKDPLHYNYMLLAIITPVIIISLTSIIYSASASSLDVLDSLGRFGNAKQTKQHSFQKGERMGISRAHGTGDNPLDWGFVLVITASCLLVMTYKAPGGKLKNVFETKQKRLKLRNIHNEKNK